MTAKIVRVLLVLVGLALVGLALVGFSSPEEPKLVVEPLAIPATPSAPDETASPEVTVPPTETATPVPPTSLPPPPPPPPPSATRPAFSFRAPSRVLGFHVVQPRESLYCIGRAYGVSPDAIARHNYLSRNAGLSIGQVLEIPDSPWWSYVPGETCPPQFPVPPFDPPVVTAYPTYIPGSGATTGSNTGTGSGGTGSSPATAPAGPTPTPSVETRTVEVTGPKEMPLGASDEVVLIFKPQPAGPVEPTPTPVTPTTPSPTPTKSGEPLNVPEPVGVPDVFDHCQVFAIARLDAVGFDVSPLTDARFPVSKGVPLTWRWSIKPLEAERQKFIVSLRLDFAPSGSEPCDAEMQLWDESFDVKVTKTVFKLSNVILHTLQLVSGFLVGAVGLLGDIRKLLNRNKTEPKKGETPKKEESKKGETPEKDESKKDETSDKEESANG